jgi:prevent-host-death family protein
MATQLEISTLGTSLLDAVEKARRGEDVTLSDHGKPVARIVSVEPDRSQRDKVFGLLKGSIWIADDFDSPLPEDELREWEK